MSDRLNEYFASEALEYLDGLERLLLGSREPEADDFFRLATGVRGSTQMAEAEGVVVLAEALEDAARGLASGSARWSEEVHSLAAATVHDLKGLIGALGRWGPAEDDRLRNAVDRWDRAGSPDFDSQDGERVVSISDLFYDDAGPHILEPVAQQADSSAAVPIRELLFAGSAALREVLALRPRVEEAAHGGGSAQLDDLLEELFELVELGMGTDPTE